MKIRRFIIGTIIILLLALGVYFHCNGLVFVDNKPAINVHLDFADDGKHIFIPVVSTLCELGYEKVSENNDVIELQNKNQILTLDLNALTLLSPQSPVNCIGPMPGNTYYFCERKDNEIFIDSVTFLGTLSCIDCNYTIALDDPYSRIVKFTYHERMDFDQILEEFLETLPEESSSPDTPDIVTEGRLIVNGADITEGNYVRIHHGDQNAELPILAILRALGYDAQMQYNNVENIYESNIDNHIGHFSTQNEDFGVHFASGEKGCVRKIENNDFIIDRNCIFTIMYWVYEARITVDYDTSTVYVDSCDPWA